MRYYVEYGCTCENCQMIIESDDYEEVANFAYDSARESYESFAGLHGILSLEDVCEEQGISDVNSEEAWDAYNETVEEDIYYHIEEFDESNPVHKDTLDEMGIDQI